MPMKRYYHMTSYETLVNYILPERRLKVGRFDMLNDPFELACFNQKEQMQRELFRKIKREYVNKYGVLCFSQNFESPLMWAHYADSHRGVCLGFDVPAEELDEVNYESKRLVADVEGNLQSTDLWRFLTTKFKQWSYEKESRWIIKWKELTCQNSMHFKAFSDDLQLCEIVLGLRCMHTADELRALLQWINRPVIIHHARAAFSTFKIDTFKSPSSKKKPITIFPLDAH